MVVTFTFDFIEIFINWYFLNLQIHLNTILHFSFLVGLRLLSIDIFLNRNYNGCNVYFWFDCDFLLNLQLHLHNIFHFSFLVELRLLSIDIFLNL